MVNPNFKSVNARNYKEYGLSDERFQELKDKKAIIIGAFIDGLPVVFNTTDLDMSLQDFMMSSARKYNDMLKSFERVDKKVKK